jgi:hypothetical protein
VFRTCVAAATLLIASVSAAPWQSTPDSAPTPGDSHPTGEQHPSVVMGHLNNCLGVQEHIYWMTVELLIKNSHANNNYFMVHSQLQMTQMS